MVTATVKGAVLHVAMHQGVHHGVRKAPVPVLWVSSESQHAAANESAVIVPPGQLCVLQVTVVRLSCHHSELVWTPEAAVVECPNSATSSNQFHKASRAAHLQNQVQFASLSVWRYRCFALSSTKGHTLGTGALLYPTAQRQSR